MDGHRLESLGRRVPVQDEEPHRPVIELENHRVGPSF